MKKTLLAIALAAAVVPAWGQAVVSSNIVGYEKIEIPVNAQDIIGVQFQDIGVSGSVNLQNITQEGYSEEGGDWIKIYDPATSRYTTAYYWGESADGGVYESADADEPLGPGWGDLQQNVIDVDLTTGQGLWTQAVAGGKIIVAGEVGENNEVAVPKNSMTLIANPLPTEVSLQQIVPTGYSEEGGDWIKIYDPATSRYTTAYYWGESADGGVYESADADEPIGPGWGDLQQNIIRLQIRVGQGMWTQSVNGGKLAFPEIAQ